MSTVATTVAASLRTFTEDPPSPALPPTPASPSALPPATVVVPASSPAGPLRKPAWTISFLGQNCGNRLFCTRPHNHHGRHGTAPLYPHRAQEKHLWLTIRIVNTSATTVDIDVQTAHALPSTVSLPDVAVFFLGKVSQFVFGSDGDDGSAMARLWMAIANEGGTPRSEIVTALNHCAGDESPIDAVTALIANSMKLPWPPV